VLQACPWLQQPGNQQQQQQALLYLQVLLGSS
jgi:hypothetical protein